ncbi:hypothetical protein BH23BAC1_BH23BAC1_12530 [soil metagenome]
MIKANEELDSFVYVASHDLKAPISNIESLLDLIRKKIENKLSEDEIHLFDLISTSIEKFNINLKDLGRIISVEKDLEEDYILVDIKSVVEDVTADINEIIVESKACIIEDFKVEKIFYAQKNLRSIIYNLLSNAIKYRSPERDPEIYISTYEDKNDIVLKVKDNGLGLNMAQQEKMFSMFKRFHNHVEGSGVGLYLLKKIIDNTGGRIQLESSEGIGSEFTVYFKNINGIA